MQHGLTTYRYNYLPFTFTFIPLPYHRYILNYILALFGGIHREGVAKRAQAHVENVIDKDSTDREYCIYFLNMGIAPTENKKGFLKKKKNLHLGKPSLNIFCT